MSKNKNMRNAVIRVSGTNIAKHDNESLGIHAGDTITYNKDDILNTLETWTKTKYFHYFMIEHNDDPNNIHYHIVLEFTKNSVGSFDGIKKHFPYGLIDSCKYGVKANVQYLVHANNPEKHQYSWDEVITNSSEKLTLYKVPGRSSMDMKCQIILDKIIAGEIREYQINEIQPEIYLKYGSKIKSAFEYRQQTIIANPNRDVLVIALEGPPRVGKSTFLRAYAQTHNMSICYSSSSNDPWQDYKGEDIFVYDDFNYERTKIEDLLKALDPHNNCTVSSRYRNKLFTGSIIAIASNRRILDWYSDCDIVLRNALYRRFARVLVFGNLNTDGTVTYSINKIVHNDSVDEPWENTLHLQIIEAYRTFDLKKYINITSDESNINKFLAGIDEM